MTSMSVGAWTLTPTNWTDGLTGVLEISAVRSCGRVEDVTVYQFPAGWRSGTSAKVPKTVTAAALKLARQLF